ncbi:50S ribosomal protein L29 [Fimbriiglobus ruber]|uniref:Large ribosomal subunit protein uL29 n=1 Tax=Fimbriiglobus ruber TaxID=1908690 RepID=A0A225D475_9BACT|nr:50S ribosomal protein L29 [Fimbriiglobus ruber]OWK36390.1 LSU ribosomal protein L29p (L35e) [Fimbriiglobus ruber]
MKSKEITGMSDEQVAMTLADTEKHLFQLRFQSATDRLETPSEIKKAKKDIARIKTVQRQRQLAKLPVAPDEQIAKSIADLEQKVEGPGKRRIKRSLVRLGAEKAAREAKLAKTAKTAQPAKGK